MRKEEKQEKKINTPKNQLLRDQYKMKNSAWQEALKEIESFKSDRSHNLFKTVRNLGKNSRKK